MTESVATLGFRSPLRMHDRNRFYKYTSVEGALCALKNHTLRWSSPLTFNDPFDVPRKLSFGLTSEALSKAVRNRFAELIRTPPDDTSGLQPTLRFLVETIKRGIPEDVRQKMINRTIDDAENPVPLGTTMDDFREYWRRTLPEFRILCLCEQPGNEAMWSHYAQQFKGAVLELECSDERSSGWLLARKVNYSAAKPDVYTAEGWARFLMMPTDVGVRAVLDDATYNKSENWRYEQEWRVIDRCRPGETGFFGDYPFDALDLVGVYLGPEMDQRDCDAICSLAKHNLHTQFYDTELRHDRAIVFTERTVDRD